MPGDPAAGPYSASYGYDAIDTCAGDSTCKIACPVGIDTGAMMKAFRHQRHSAREERNADLAAKRAALTAHASQTSDVGMMLAMPTEVFALAFGTEYYIEPGQAPGMRDVWFLDDGEM